MTEQAKVPAIRFAGFTDPWEQRKLGELFEESDERASDREILSVSVANGIYPASESDRETNPGASLANYKIVHFGDVVYNSMRMWQGAVDASRYDGIVSPAYVVARPNSEVYARFFARLLRQPMLLKQYQQVSQGNSKDTQVLKFDDFASIGISMPASENEQRRIGGFFDRLDSLITLHQRKYDKLTNVKKSMLEKMFPKNGSNVPEIRFKAITEAWEQRKVLDVANRFDNLRIPVAANLRVHGTTPYYGANGIQDYVDGFTHDGEFVLVAEDGANDLKNYPVKCVNGRIWVNNHAHVLQGKAGIADNSFLAFAISQSDIESLLVGGGRAKLNAETLMSIEFRLPCLQEQYRIGEYLSQLDNLITLHQRVKSLKIDIITKKGVLNNGI